MPPQTKIGNLDRVSTTCDSGWVRSHAGSALKAYAPTRYRRWYWPCPTWNSHSLPNEYSPS